MSKNIPNKIEEELYYRTDRKCPLCKNKGHHIHHIDGDNSNNNLDNLVLLCFKHHSEIEKSGGLEKKLTDSELKRFRDEWYERVKRRRENEAKPNFSASENNLEEDEIFQLALDASIVAEVTELGRELELKRSNGWEDPSLIFSKFEYLSYKSDKRGRYALLRELANSTTFTRHDMPVTIAEELSTLILTIAVRVIPNQNENSIDEIKLRAIREAITATSGIAYDGAIYRENIKIVETGGGSLYRIGARLKDINDDLYEEVVEEFKSILNHKKLKNETYKKLLNYQLEQTKDGVPNPLTYPGDISTKLRDQTI
jgi:hypothetical protein